MKKTITWITVGLMLTYALDRFAHTAVASTILQQAYNLIQDEGSNLARRTTLNFTGSGVTCSDSAGKTVCNVPGGGGGGGYTTIEDEGTPLTMRDTLNFIGAGVTCVDNSGASRTDCTIPGGGGGGGLSALPPYLYDGVSSYYAGPHNTLMTIPPVMSFSWLTTQGSATETNTNGSLVLAAPAATGDNVRARGLNIGMNTTLTASIACTSLEQNFTGCGIGFRESGTGKLITLSVQMATIQPEWIVVANWNGETSFGANLYTTAIGWQPPVWCTFRLVYNAGSPGTVHFLYSFDDVNFVEVFSENANVHFTTAPDQWFYYGNSNNSGGSTTVYTTLYSFNQT